MYAVCKSPVAVGMRYEARTVKARVGVNKGVPGIPDLKL